MKKKVKFILSGIFIISLIFIISVSANSQVVNLASDIKDFFFEANADRIAGIEMVHKFGINEAVGTTPEDIWGVGGTLNFLTSAENLNVTSTNENDNITGSNARTIFIAGLDGNFTEIQEYINLSGTNVIQTQNQYLRLFRMYVDEVGTYGATNAGDIDAVSSSTNNIQGRILTGDGQTVQTHYTIPKGKTGQLSRASISMDTGKAITLNLKIRTLANNTANSIKGTRILHHWNGLDIPVGEEFKANHVFDEKTDVWFSGFVSSGTAVIQVDYDLIIEEK